jgi:integrase
MVLIAADLPTVVNISQHAKEYINQAIQGIKNPRDRMLAVTLWNSGIRVSEAVALTKGNIDFQNKVMTVRWLKNRKYNERVVPMHSDLAMLLLVYCGTLKLEERVFPITRQRAWQIITECFKESPHQLRHSFAVHWLRSGGDIVVLHRILGHSKIQTTMEYLKIVPIDQSKELDKISFR